MNKVQQLRLIIQLDPNLIQYSFIGTLLRRWRKKSHEYKSSHIWQVPSLARKTPFKTWQLYVQMLTASSRMMSYTWFFHGCRGDLLTRNDCAISELSERWRRTAGGMMEWQSFMIGCTPEGSATDDQLISIHNRSTKLHGLISILSVISHSTSQTRGEKSGAWTMKRVAAGTHLPTTCLFKPAKRPGDTAEYCLDCSFTRFCSWMNWEPSSSRDWK